MKKLVLLSVIFLLLTGCSSVYNVEITDNTIKEEFITSIPDSERVGNEILDQYSEPDDPITPFISEDQYPFVDNKEIIYKKDVKRNGNNTIVKLSCEYDIDDFKRSRVYNECFEKSYIKREDGYLRLGFVGEFYCLYGDSLKINIKPKNKVINDTSNDVNNGVYSWTINDNNVDKVNIQMIIEDNQDTQSSNKIVLILLGVLIIFVIFGIIIFRKRK